MNILTSTIENGFIICWMYRLQCDHSAYRTTSHYLDFTNATGSIRQALIMTFETLDEA